MGPHGDFIAQAQPRSCLEPRLQSRPLLAQGERGSARPPPPLPAVDREEPTSASSDNERRERPHAHGSFRSSSHSHPSHPPAPPAVQAKNDRRHPPPPTCCPRHPEERIRCPLSTTERETAHTRPPVIRQKTRAPLNLFHIQKRIIKTLGQAHARARHPLSSLHAAVTSPLALAKIMSSVVKSAALRNPPRPKSFW